jgi:UDP-galactopyranose mutase
MYDYLIVGAGLYGSVFAYEAGKRNKSCLVIDKKSHIGGNCFTEKIEGINVHVYGPHIFHTSNKDIWEYVNRFAEFNNFRNAPIANFNGSIYNLPFNMNTFNKLWGTITPEEAKRKIADQTRKYMGLIPTNLEEQALKFVGEDIYNIFIKGYSEKQWGRKCTELPPFLLSRIPLRFEYNNNYFEDIYQGVPIGGYTQMFGNMLKGQEVRLKSDFFKDYKDFRRYAKKMIFTGMIDEFFGYRFGKLEYRSLKFQTEILDTDNFQGNAIVNYTDAKTPFTRIVEHKHFDFGKQKRTVITHEYPISWQKGREPYYPVNDKKNNDIYKKISEESEKEKDIRFGGRLGNYQYYNMDEVINKCLEDINDEFRKL